MEEHQWRQVAKDCSTMAIENAPRFYSLFGTTAISPLTLEWIGQMVSIPILTSRPEELQRLLFTQYHIEVPFMRHGNQVYMRYSINGFNTLEDLDALYNALLKLKNESPNYFH